jgi:hypothetical protein
VIELDTLREAAHGLPTRYDRHADTLEWLTSTFTTQPTDLVPKPEGEEGSTALARLVRMVNSLGPRVAKIKRDGTIGDITWGGESNQVDDAIRALDLDDFTGRLFDRAFALGIAGVVPLDDDGPRLARLGGHVETILDPFDVDVTLGLLQVQVEKRSQATVSYRMRVWDLTEPETMLREWITTSPTRLDGDGKPVPAPTPHWIVTATAPDGRPIGEFQQSLPSIKSEWATQLRGDRVEESTAFPQAVIKGEVPDAEKRGPTRIIEVSEGGDYKYVIPGDLTGMHNHHDRKLERIRDDLSLPGGALGGQTPSGEALREANQKFIASCRNYARLLTRLLTGAVGDYLALLGLPPVPISVDVNREFEKAERVRFIIDLYREQLIEFGAAVRSVSVYVPTWSDAEVEEFITQQTRVVTPDELRAALGAGDAA